MSKIKCYSVRLAEMISVSAKSYKAVAYDGSTAFIPKSMVFGYDEEVQKSVAVWIAAFILEKEDCGLQFSTKKVQWFNR